MATFLFIVLGVWTAMHAYVVVRLVHLPVFTGPGARRLVSWAAVALALSYPLARIAEARGWHLIGVALEAVGTTWMGLLFLLLASLVVVDMVTGVGHLFRDAVVPLRAFAASLAVALAATGLAIGLSRPVVSRHAVVLADLPAELDGTVIVAVSDLHVGSLIGPRWAEELVERIAAMHPDIVCFVGDIVEGGRTTAAPFLPIFQRLHPPLGTWAVTGNHEYYAGLEESLAVFREAGLTPLRDEWREVAPGLIIAGVDDLTARRQFGESGDAFVPRAVTGRPAGTTVLLSHTPWEIEAAAAEGVDLVLSGHTHDGQIWPFRYLVKARYAFVGGRYEVGGTTLLVGRGTGTWGPRMRLWRPSEILAITLRAKATPVS